MKSIFKKPPVVDKLPISSFIMHKSHYKIDKTYQRDSDVWEKWMEAYLIDTILRGLSIPLIYIHKKNGKEYIVDGQQRINTINKFYKNKIELMERFSKDIIKGNGSKTLYKDLKYEYKQQFDSYPINIAYLDSYSDEDIRSMFRRLQSGKPLNPGEKLNSFGGNIVPTLRTLANHKFFRKVTSYSDSRHKHLFLVSQLLFLEHLGICDLRSNDIFLFAEKNESIKEIRNSLKTLKRNLNYLYSTFRENTGEIEKPGWIISLYLFVSNLRKNYAISKSKSNLKEFFIDFYHKINNAPNTRNITYNKFYEAISKSTTSKKNILLRQDIMTRHFIKEYNPPKLDENRLFSKKQKLEIFRRDKEQCKVCAKKMTFKSSQTNYHHLEMHMEGGETDINNGVLVCQLCHSNKLHKRK